MVKWNTITNKKKNYVNFVNINILQTALVEAYPKKIAAIEHNYQQLSLKLNKRKHPISEIDDIFVSRKNKVNRLRWCEVKHTYIQRETDKWQQKRVQLVRKTSSTASLVYLHKITNPDPTTTVMFSHNSDTCSSCNEPLLFDHIQYNNICPTCHRVTRVLIASEDFSTDILVFKAQTEINISSIKPAIKNIKINRTPLYRRYLYQFSKDLPEIPKEVFTLIYLNLSSVHILSSARSKHTPISSIMRNNGMTQYIHQSVRISKLFNGQKIPEMNDVLLDKLVRRFDIICQACANGYKLLPFEMITHILLNMENEHDMADCFSLASSKQVLRKSYSRLEDIVNVCEKIDPTISWKIDPLV